MPTLKKRPDPQKLTKSHFKSKSEIVYRTIRKALIEGKFKPGDRIEPEKLAADIEVSRIPIREALKRLQAEGLVNIIPHKAVLVAMVDTDEIKDIMTVRSLLEGFAIRKAIKKITEKDIARLRTIYRVMEEKTKSRKSRTVLELTKKNREFHQEIIRICGNKQIESICSNLFDISEQFTLQFVFSQDRADRVLKEHRNLIEAIEARDPIKAEKLMHTHITWTEKGIINLLNHK